MYLPASLLRCLIFSCLVGACFAACVNTVPVAEDKTLRAAAQQPVPLRPPSSGQAASPYTLAIVPWKTTRREYVSELNGLAALRTSLTHTAFVPVISAYDVSNNQTTRFPQTEHALRQSVWGWRTPGQGPTQEAVWYLGEQLGVDAILAYGMEPQGGTDTLWVHLYDIPHKRHYVLEGECYYFETEAAGVLAGLTQTLFGTFRDYRAQRGTQ